MQRDVDGLEERSPIGTAILEGRNTLNRLKTHTQELNTPYSTMWGYYQLVEAPGGLKEPQVEGAPRCPPPQPFAPQVWAVC